MIVGVAAAVSLVMGVCWYHASTEVVAQSQLVNRQGQDLLEESRKNSELVKLQIGKDYADTPGLAEAFDTSAKGLESELREQQQAISNQQQAIVSQQRSMLWLLVGGLSGLIVVLAMAGIRFTHKVVGPIHKMKGLLRDVGDGQLNVDVKLRQGDDLREFFEVFVCMVQRLRERQASEVAALEQAMRYAALNGASEQALSEIAKLHDQMTAALRK